MTDEYQPNRLGTVVSAEDTPNVMRFDFVVEGGPSEVLARRGQFVAVSTEEGLVIGRVQDLVRTNRYYQHAEAVREYQSRGEPLKSIFPTDRWQYTVAQVGVAGLWVDGRTVRPYFAVSPGSVVRRVDEATLAAFLRLDTNNGLALGRIGHHELVFAPAINRLLSKHLAILAMSGAGKSYFVSVLLEELLKRKREAGRIAVIVIDVHGEYGYLKDIMPEHLGVEEGTFKVDRLRGPQFQIPVQSLTAEALGALVSDMSSVQVRDLRRVVFGMREELRKGYTLTDVIDRVRDDESINKNTKDALISWLTSLEDTGLFGKEESPDISSIVKPGLLTLVDLSDFVSLRKKQIIVSYLAGELLSLRRQGRIPPFLLVLEEAHQFCPESRHELALPRDRIETIAREGRKFHALLCLVSQRPVKLSTTVLSQCSNQAILRTTNPYDLDHIGRTSEGIDRASLDAITTLEVGEALFVGECVSVPTFVKIRTRLFNPAVGPESLEEALKRAERSQNA
ncbi:MAG: ATP-binding protein [Candidatus Thorarchaeota archaeon]|nr:ATP-binding protein [Candidatus Thorarchaeota archaeon]